MRRPPSSQLDIPPVASRVVLASAEIIHSENSTARIFGFVKTPATWGELVSGVTDDPDQAVWIHELCRSLKAAAKKKIVAPIHASLKTEAQTRGFTDAELLLRLFRPEGAEKIRTYFEYWRKMRNPDETGELDLALRTSDTAKIREVLDAVEGINEDFLVIVSKRFAEKISQRLG